MCWAGYYYFHHCWMLAKVFKHFFSWSSSCTGSKSTTSSCLIRKPLRDCSSRMFDLPKLCHVVFRSGAYARDFIWNTSRNICFAQPFFPPECGRKCGLYYVREYDPAVRYWYVRQLWAPQIHPHVILLFTGAAILGQFCPQPWRSET